MLRLLVVLLLSSSLLPSNLAAADESKPAPLIISAYSVLVNPSEMAAMEAMVKETVAANRQLETKRYWTTWRQRFGVPNQLVFVRSFSSFSAMNEAPLDELAEAFGKKRAVQIREGWAGAETVQSGVWAHNPKLSAGESAAGQPTMSMWLQTEVAPGASERYMAYLEKVAEATRKVAPEISYQTFMPIVGEPQMWIFAVDVSWEAMDAPRGSGVNARLEKAFGPREAERLDAIRTNTVTKAGWVMAQADPELSYWPAAPVASR